MDAVRLSEVRDVVGGVVRVWVVVVVSSGGVVVDGRSARKTR